MLFLPLLSGMGRQPDSLMKVSPYSLKRSAIEERAACFSRVRLVQARHLNQRIRERAEYSILLLYTAEPIG